MICFWARFTGLFCSLHSYTCEWKPCICVALCSSGHLHSQCASVMLCGALQDRSLLLALTYTHPEICTIFAFGGDSHNSMLSVPFWKQFISEIPICIWKKSVTQLPEHIFQFLQILQALAATTANFDCQCPRSCVSLLLIPLLPLLFLCLHLLLRLCVHECSSEKQVLSHLELIIKISLENSRLWEGGYLVTSVMGSPFLLRASCSL